MNKKLEGWFSCENMPKEPMKTVPCTPVYQKHYLLNIETHLNGKNKIDFQAVSSYETIKRITNS